jgi:hypothetical protein
MINMIFSLLDSQKNSDTSVENKTEKKGDNPNPNPNPNPIPNIVTDEDESNHQFVLDILLVLKFIAYESDIGTIEKMLKTVLSNTGGGSIQVPVFLFPSLLDFIVDLTQIRYTFLKSDHNKSSILLSNDTAVLLRTLIVKGFHGGIPRVRVRVRIRIRVTVRVSVRVRVRVSVR